MAVLARSRPWRRAERGLDRSPRRDGWLQLEQTFRLRWALREVAVWFPFKRVRENMAIKRFYG